MNRIISEQSRETRALIAAFVAMSLGQEYTFDQISEIVGFRVNSSLPAYHSARRIAARDHNVVIDGIRGVGFRRLPADQIVTGRGNRHMRSILRRAKVGVREMTIAILGNLSESVSQDASEKLTRFRLFGDLSKNAKSNRRSTVDPPRV